MVMSPVGITEVCTRDAVNKQEMTGILSEHLTRYRERPFAELRSLLESKQVDTFEVKGPSGADYRVVGG